MARSTVGKIGMEPKNTTHSKNTGRKQHAHEHADGKVGEGTENACMARSKSKGYEIINAYKHADGKVGTERKNACVARFKNT